MPLASPVLRNVGEQRHRQSDFLTAPETRLNCVRVVHRIRPAPDWANLNWNGFRRIRRIVSSLIRGNWGGLGPFPSFPKFLNCANFILGYEGHVGLRLEFQELVEQLVAEGQCETAKISLRVSAAKLLVPARLVQQGTKRCEFSHDTAFAARN